MLVDTPSYEGAGQVCEGGFVMAKWMMTVMSALALSCLGADKNTIPQAPRSVSIQTTDSTF